MGRYLEEPDGGEDVVLESLSIANNEVFLGQDSVGVEGVVLPRVHQVLDGLKEDIRVKDLFCCNGWCLQCLFYVLTLFLSQLYYAALLL